MSPEKLFSSKFIYQECLNSQSILSVTDTFEEYSLLHRTRQIKNWRKHFPVEDLFPIWIGYAVFLLNFYINISKKQCIKPIFLCLTIDNFEEEEKEDGLYMVPALFTSTALNRSVYLQALKEKTPIIDSKDMVKVKVGFEAAGMLKNFHFYESRFFDVSSQSEIVRIYCVN